MANKKFYLEKSAVIADLREKQTSIQELAKEYGCFRGTLDWLLRDLSFEERSTIKYQRKGKKWVKG